MLTVVIGDYRDRRNEQQVDLKKTIWVMATNALDNAIMQFCRLNGVLVSEDGKPEEKCKLQKTLSKELRDQCKHEFGVSIPHSIPNQTRSRPRSMFIHPLTSMATIAGASHGKNLGDHLLPPL